MRCRRQTRSTSLVTMSDRDLFQILIFVDIWGKHERNCKNKAYIAHIERFESSPFFKNCNLEFDTNLLINSLPIVICYIIRCYEKNEWRYSKYWCKWVKFSFSINKEMIYSFFFNPYICFPSCILLWILIYLFLCFESRF